MTEQDYLLAWGLYAIAALGCLLVWFRMTGWIWRWLREPLRVVVAVLLLTPTIVRNPEEARRLTDEYGSRFRALEPIYAPKK